MEHVKYSPGRKVAVELIELTSDECVQDFITFVASSSLEEYGTICMETAQDSERCHEMLDEYVPTATETDVPDTAARKAERIRLALIAGKLTEAQAFKMLSLVAATIVVDSKAAMMKEMFYLHDVICGVTNNRPETIYDLSNERHVVDLANAHHYKMHGE